MTTNHTLLNVVRSQGPGKSIDALLIDNLETKHGSMIAGKVQWAVLATLKVKSLFNSVVMKFEYCAHSARLLRKLKSCFALNTEHE